MTPVELLSGNRWAAIEELVGHLVSSGKLPDSHREAVIAALKKRETSMSTGIGHGIGLPHASTDLVAELVSIAGRSKSGIDFESLDGQPVHKVILFLVPAGKFNEHTRALAEFVQLAQQIEV